MADGSSDPGSLFNLGKTPRADAAAAANPSSTNLTQTFQVGLAQGFATRPVIQAASAVAADYYRYGEQGTAAPGTPTVAVPFNVVPRKLDDFSNSETNNECSIRVLGKLSANSADVDLVPPYTKFILESVQEAHNERSQIVETFGDFYVFFYGQRPPVYNYSGTLINSKNANWVQDFMFYYENYLRGTQCAQNNARLVLTYGGRQVEGFMLNTSNATVAATDYGVQFSFQILILDRKILGLSDDFGVTVVGGQLVQNLAFLNMLQNTAHINVSTAFGKATAALSGSTPSGTVSLLNAGSAGNVSSQFGVNAVPSLSGGIQIG